MREYSCSEIYEPGHSFEWCSLLLEASQYDMPYNLDINKMANSAEINGTTDAKLVLPTIGDKNSNDEIKIRIWPSLERVRYYSMNCEYDKVATGFESLIAHFFSKDGLPFEYIDREYNVTQTNVKSTTGYHIINCFKYIIIKERNNHGPLCNW